MNLATRTYELAIQHSGQLAGFTAPPTASAVNFDYNAGQVPFQHPTVPRLDAAEFELRTLSEPERSPPLSCSPRPELIELPNESLPTPTLVYSPNPSDFAPVMAGRTIHSRARALMLQLGQADSHAVGIGASAAGDGRRAHELTGPDSLR